MLFVLFFSLSLALETLDKSLRRYYDTAMEIVAQLVANETPMIGFLRTADYHPVKAATRLALYWKYRSEVFKERWLLPMVQTGRGALTLPEIALLRTGYLYFQPAVGTQQAFVCVDFSRANKVFEEGKAMGWNLSEMVERVNLYCTTVCPDADSQIRGALLFYPVSSSLAPALEFRPSIWNYVRNVAPIKLTGLLVPQAFEPNKCQLLEFKRIQTATVIGFNSGFKPVEIEGNSTAQTIWQINNAGISREFVPICLGGCFNVDAKVAEWARVRISLEELADSPRALVALSKPSRKSSTSVLVKRKREEEAESEKDFIRKRNAVYSRRMYHKRKLELLSLQEEIKMWEDKNAAARVETQRLENLIAQACALVNRFEESSQGQNCVSEHAPQGTFDGHKHGNQHHDRRMETTTSLTKDALLPSSFSEMFGSQLVPDLGLPFQTFEDIMSA